MEYNDEFNVSSDTNNENNATADNRKNKVIALVALLMAILIGVTVYFFVNKDDNKTTTGDESNKTGETSVNSSSTPSPATTDFKTSGETTTNESNTTTEVTSNDDIPTEYYEPDDPRLITPSLTAPTTVRVEGELMEAPPLDDPAYGEPNFLAKSFLNKAMSLCVREDTSYNKNFRDNINNRVTENMMKNGFGEWADTHSESWIMASNNDACNSLIAIPTIRNTHITGKDEIAYDVTIDLNLTTINYRGMKVSENLTPIEGLITMKFVDNKWLVDKFSVDAGVIPDMR